MSRSENEVKPNAAESVNPSATQEKKGSEEESKQKDKAGKWYVGITVLLLIIIIILILLLLRQCSAEVPVLNPDYPPQSIEANAKPIPGGGADKLDYAQGGGAVILDYNDRCNVDLSDKVVKLTFANPGRSTQDMVLQLVVQDVVIAQSGRIMPGYELSKLDLLSDVEKMLSEGVYKGKFVINYYNPETNERAMVNSEAAVAIHVYP